MNRLTPARLATAVLLGSALLTSPAYAQTLNDAITGGKLGGRFNLRYEGVEQDNALEDASALTLRSSISYTTGVFQGFSAMLEMEDVRPMFGIDDYTVGPSGFNPGLYSVVADPDTTELNQGYLQYAGRGFTAKLGRQVITHDSHRFIGSVPWRQDWQTFDAFTMTADPNENLNLSYSFLDGRERIFAEDADQNSSDHLFRAAYKAPVGTFVGYAYLLELDDTPAANGLDTWGLRYNGSGKLGELPATWLAEVATQESQSGPVTYDADYLLLEGGLTWSGVNAKLGYEMLGSDNNAYAFQTPLATLHAFNGWADMFLTTPAVGLQDAYLNLSGKLLGGTLTAVYHDYEADDATPVVSDLGSEVNLQYTRPFATRYTLGLKVADYHEGDLALPETRKAWVWLQATF